VTVRNRGARAWTGRVGFLLTPATDNWWRNSPRTVTTTSGQVVWPTCLDAYGNGGNEPLYQVRVTVKPGRTLTLRLWVEMNTSGEGIQLIPARGAALLPGFRITRN
jgi:hypothetical protein